MVVLHTVLSPRLILKSCGIISISGKMMVAVQNIIFILEGCFSALSKINDNYTGCHGACYTEVVVYFVAQESWDSDDDENRP